MQVLYLCMASKVGQSMVKEVCMTGVRRGEHACLGGCLGALARREALVM